MQHVARIIKLLRGDRELELFVSMQLCVMNATTTLQLHMHGDLTDRYVDRPTTDPF
jgi:hypothetical protein